MNIRKTILLAIAAMMLQAAVGCEEKKSEAGRLYTLTAAVPQRPTSAKEETSSNLTGLSSTSRPR